MRCVLRLLPLPAAFLLLSLSAFAQAGRWEGNVNAGGHELQIGLDILKNAKGEWTGTFSQTPPGIRDVPMVELKVAEKTVRFHVLMASGPEFVCKLSAAEAMGCSLTTPTGVTTFDMKRTGDAKVNEVKPSPAVSKQLEGDWEGNLETPRGALKIVMHFKNQPDGTVNATLDSPTQGAAALQVSDVAQKDLAVEWKVPMITGTYKGTLNKEASEITGEWSQSGAALALVLHRPAPPAPPAVPAKK